VASFSFNGIKKDYVYTLRGRRRPAWAPRTLNWLNVPGMPGAHLESVETSLRPYDVPIGIKAENIGDLQKIKEDLAEWLLHDEMKELIFEDEPDRTYFAIVDGTFDLEELVRVGKGVITFICDPYKYGPEKEAVFPSDVVSLNYEGTAPGDPIFELEVLQPVTFAMIQNQNDDYMMIGKPINVVEDTAYEKETLLLHDTCSSLTGWTNTGTVVDGVVSGDMVTNGAEFEPNSYGSSVSQWHGPAYKKSIQGGPIQDFRLETLVGFYSKNSSKYIGRVEVYLLDDQGRMVCKVALKDVYDGKSTGWAEVRAGDSDINYYFVNHNENKWSSFFGVLRLTREGNKWKAYIAKVDRDTGKHHSVYKKSWTDVDNVFSRNVAQVQIHFGKRGSYNPPPMEVSDIKVYKLNPEQTNQTPYIAQPGDVILFEHKNKDLLINGESRKDLKDFGARYFELEKGENTLIVHPSDSFNVSCHYRERFK